MLTAVQVRGRLSLPRHAGLLPTQPHPCPLSGCSPIHLEPEEVPHVRTEAPLAGNWEHQGKGWGQSCSWPAPGWVALGESCHLSEAVSSSVSWGEWKPPRELEEREVPSAEHLSTHTGSFPRALRQLHWPLWASFSTEVGKGGPTTPSSQAEWGVAQTTQHRARPTVASPHPLLPGPPPTCPLFPDSPPPGAEGTKLSLCSPRGRSWPLPTVADLLWPLSYDWYISFVLKPF